MKAHRGSVAPKSKKEKAAAYRFHGSQKRGRGASSSPRPSLADWTESPVSYFALMEILVEQHQSEKFIVKENRRISFDGYLRKLVGSSYFKRMRWCQMTWGANIPFRLRGPLPLLRIKAKQHILEPASMKNCIHHV